MFHRIHVRVDILVEFDHLFAQLLRLAIRSLSGHSAERERERERERAHTLVLEYVSEYTHPTFNACMRTLDASLEIFVSDRVSHSIFLPTF
jgi:hypothetical protein